MMIRHGGFSRFFVAAAMLLGALGTLNAQEQQPMSVEQRLALDIANLNLQRAGLALQVDRLMIENARLKSELEEVRKKVPAEKP